MGKEHDRARTFAQQSPGDVAQESMQYDFLLQRASDNEIDLVLLDCAQNCRRRIALLIMDRSVLRQCEPLQRRYKLRTGIVRFLADINQTEFRIKTVANPFRFRQDLLETG